MTQCNAEPIRFSSLGRKNVVADFAGGTITSDAGGLLLREADRRLGLTRALAEAVPDPHKAAQDRRPRAHLGPAHLPQPRQRPSPASTLPAGDPPAHPRGRSPAGSPLTPQQPGALWGKGGGLRRPTDSAPHHPPRLTKSPTATQSRPCMKYPG